MQTSCSQWKLEAGRSKCWAIVNIHLQLFHTPKWRVRGEYIDAVARSQERRTFHSKSGSFVIDLPGSFSFWKYKAAVYVYRSQWSTSHLTIEFNQYKIYFFFKSTRTRDAGNVLILITKMVSKIFSQSAGWSQHQRCDLPQTSSCRSFRQSSTLLGLFFELSFVQDIGSTEIPGR